MQTVCSTPHSLLTIKELTETVGGGITPRMVRHYHQLGLLPPAQRSGSNYRLYTEQDVQRLRRIVALKQQGFQLSHIQRVLEADDRDDPAHSLVEQLQQQYQTVMQQLVKLRQTALALEGLLGRDRHCQQVQAEALSQLRLFEAEAQAQGVTDNLWGNLDAAVSNHPENFQDALQHLLPDLSERSEIEVDLLSQLVLACGDVSLVPFVRLSRAAIKAAREALQSGCPIVCDVPLVAAALDQTRLAHLGCPITTLTPDSHISSAAEAERCFWQVGELNAADQKLASQQLPKEQLKAQNSAKPASGLTIPNGCVVVIGYAPSALISLCEAIASGQVKPALVIGMPIGFSHAPAAKRRLMQSSVNFITIEGTLGGGLLAAVALNALATSLIEKPNCHCYLTQSTSIA